MNKLRIGIAAASSVGLLVMYQLYSSYVLQQEQLENYQAHAARLELELERTGDAQVGYETEINRLGRQISSQQAAISRLEEELENAHQQIDPNLATLEQEIRERVIVEVQSRAARQQLSRLEMIKELNKLDQLEMAQLMSLQGQYGGFLQSLDVDDDRLEVIADALLNQVAAVNQRRVEIFEARANNDRSNIQEIRRAMREINSPEYQREALSYVFTDEEMAAFERFQETQSAQGGLASATFIGSPNGGVLQRGGGPGGPRNQNRATTIQLINPNGQDAPNGNN